MDTKKSSKKICILLFSIFMLINFNCILTLYNPFLQTTNKINKYQTSNPLPTVTPNQWNYRFSITIDYTKVNSGSNLVNFPVLINLNSNINLAQHTQTNGQDIYFTLADGITKISHEIETYNNATGELIAWIKLPVLSATANTVVYCYYGNPTAGDQSDRPGTWNSNYIGVWHLDEPAVNENTGAIHYDSTINNYNGIQHGNTQTTGKIGAAQLFDGTEDTVNDYINLGTFDPSSGDITVSAWVYWHGSSGNHQIIIAKRDFWSASEMRWQVAHNYNENILYFQNSTSLDGDEAKFPLDPPANSIFADIPSINNWVHIAVTKVGSVCYLYLNGTKYQSSGELIYSDKTSATLYIGGLNPIPPETAEVFNGRIDELTICNTALSDGWILTAYNNQSTPSAFYSLGNEEILP